MWKSVVLLLLFQEVNSSRVIRHSEVMEQLVGEIAALVKVETVSDCLLRAYGENEKKKAAFAVLTDPEMRLTCSLFQRVTAAKNLSTESAQNRYFVADLRPDNEMTCRSRLESVHKVVTAPLTNCGVNEPICKELMEMKVALRKEKPVNCPSGMSHNPIFKKCIGAFPIPRTLWPSLEDVYNVCTQKNAISLTISNSTENDEIGKIGGNCYATGLRVPGGTPFGAPWDTALRWEGTGTDSPGYRNWASGEPFGTKCDGSKKIAALFPNIKNRWKVMAIDEMNMASCYVICLAKPY